MMTDKRVERSTKSIISLRNFLLEVCANPEAFASDKSLRDALKSQGGLAKYTNLELGILPTSLNTLKRLCTEVIDGGFKALDDLRKGALVRIDEFEHRERSSNKRTRGGLVKRVNELERDLILLKQSNYLLVQALSDVISDIKSVASTDDEAARNRRSQEALRKLLAVMSVKHITHVHDPNNANVTHIVR